MTRQKPPNRRLTVNRKVPFEQSNGKVVQLLITIGFDAQCHVNEVFCADFKAGSDQHAAVMDGCILISRLFQHGENPKEIAETLGKATILKTIVEAVAEEDNGA